MSAPIFPCEFCSHVSTNYLDSLNHRCVAQEQANAVALREASLRESSDAPTRMSAPAHMPGLIGLCPDPAHTGQFYVLLDDRHSTCCPECDEEMILYSRVPDVGGIEAAYDAFTAAYGANFPTGGDNADHDEATRCGVEAVLARQIQEVAAFVRTRSSHWSCGKMAHDIEAHFSSQRQ